MANWMKEDMPMQKSVLSLVALALGVGAVVFADAAPCGACSCAPPSAEEVTLELVSLAELTEPEKAEVAVEDPEALLAGSWNDGCDLKAMPFYGRQVSLACGEGLVMLEREVDP